MSILNLDSYETFLTLLEPQYSLNSFQGGQRNIIFFIIFSIISAANKYYGSLISFIGKWNRFNLGFARTNQTYCT